MILLSSLAEAVTVCALGSDPIESCTVGLQSAVDAAAPDDVLELLEGTYTESVSIDKDLTLRAAPDAVVLVSGELGPTFAVHDADLVLDGLHATSSGARVIRITGSGSLIASNVFLRGDDQLVLRGGVVWVENGSLTLTDSRLSGGSALLEGGLISVTGDADLIDVDLDSGRSEGIGGLLHVDGQLTATGGVWSDGRALDHGGGIWAKWADLTRVELTDNHAGGAGGGGYAGNSVLTDVKISSNSADSGGGFTSFSVSGTGLEVWGNTAASGGGGLYVSGLLGLDASVICDNTAAFGGGIAGSRIAVGHSILTRNSASERGGGVHSTDNSTLSFVHLVANSAPDGAAFDMQDTAVVHSIISGNRAATGGNVFTAGAIREREQANLLWDNEGAIDDRLPRILGDPMLSVWEDCSSPLLPSYYGAARDAAASAEHPDPDGSVADMGAYAQGIFPGDLWYDSDGDGSIDLYDCAAGDPTIFPEAPDPPYDDVDQDCRGDDDFDADDDGHRPFEHGGLDCDDTNPEASPDATEILGNAVDEDCDGWAGVTAEIAPQGCNQAATNGRFHWWRR